MPSDWVDTVLVAHECTRTGEIEESQLRLWSVTMTVPTDLSPDRVVIPLAVERERGRLLSSDQGPTLWARVDADVEAWVHLVTDYAALQRDTLPHATALRDAGLDTADPAEAAVPLAFEHNDLHHDNAFPPAAPGPTGRVPLRFFDFGDALWAHPFASMRVPLAMAAHEWQVEPDHPDVAAVRRAYLDQWTDLAAPDELATDLEATGHGH